MAQKRISDLNLAGEILRTALFEISQGGVSYRASPAMLGNVLAPVTLVGGHLDWTVAGNVLTCAIKADSGADPSADEPVFIAFRSVTAETGSIVFRKVTAATSVSINDTATLGTANSTAFRLWAVAFDDGGTIRLGLINCLSGTSIYPLAGWGIASSTQEGDGADSAPVFYTDGAAVAAKPYATLGYASWEIGLAAAGTWSAAPTRRQPFGVGVSLPGQAVQEAANSTGAVATGTTVMPLDDTIPQITEGDQYMTQVITPSSAANVLDVEHHGLYASSVVSSVVIAALFQDATANALAAVTGSRESAANTRAAVHIRHRKLAGTTSAATFRVRAGMDGAGTTTFNGSGGNRSFGGVSASYMTVKEIMA